MLKCKKCKSNLVEAGSVRLNAVMYVGNPLAAFAWTGDTRSKRSLLMFFISFLFAGFTQSISAMLIMLVFLGYHLLVVNDPKQLFKCPSCPEIYVGNCLLEYRRDDDLYI